MDFSVDTSGMDALAEEFGKLPAKVGLAVRHRTEKAARKVQDDARAMISGRTSLPSYPDSITYEVHSTMTGTVAEIGPEEGGQGSLGHLIENGTPTSGPNPHMRPAFDAEAEVWGEDLARIAGNVL